MVETATMKVAFGSSLLGTMVLFQDPAYMLIATMGAFVSMGSGYYDLKKLKIEKKSNNEECSKDLILELSKSFFVGFIFSLLSFMLFLQVGGEAMADATGKDWFGQLLPSFWLVFTVALATEAPSFWDKGKNFLVGKKDNK